MIPRSRGPMSTPKPEDPDPDNPDPEQFFGNPDDPRLLPPRGVRSGI